MPRSMAKAHYRRGVALAELKRYDEAAGSLRRAQQPRPHSAFRRPSHASPKLRASPAWLKCTHSRIGVLTPAWKKGCAIPLSLAVLAHDTEDPIRSPSACSSAYHLAEPFGFRTPSVHARWSFSPATLRFASV